MFYVKEQVNGLSAICIEIDDENVFCRCPHCGAEVQVDLADIFSDGNIDLFSTSVLCDRCAKKVMGGRTGGR